MHGSNPSVYDDAAVSLIEAVHAHPTCHGSLRKTAAQKRSWQMDTIIYAIEVEGTSDNACDNLRVAIRRSILTIAALVESVSV